MKNTQGLIDLNQYEKQQDFANESKEGLLFSAGNNQGGNPVGKS